MMHLIVGAILPYMAIVPTVVAWRRRRPFPVATTIHVPLGVLLFGLSLHLARLAREAGG